MKDNNRSSEISRLFYLDRIIKFPFFLDVWYLRINDLVNHNFWNYVIVRVMLVKSNSFFFFRFNSQMIIKSK